MNHRYATFVLAALIAGCAPKPEPAPDPAPPASEAPAPAAPTAPAELPPPDESPAAPAQPAPDAPPPTEPSPTSKPTSAMSEPALASMRVATPSAKLGVPVDLMYSFETEPLTNQPATLHLAAVPRVSGSNLQVSIKGTDGIQVAAAGVLSAQKANANGAYRQHFSVTRQATAPAELRVLITMDLPQGSGFGFFSIPLDSVKER